MATGMSFYPQAVVLKGRVYVGGGDIVLDRADNTIVDYYDIERNQWAVLPHYHYMFFAMAAVNEELVLIGGQHPISHKTTTEIQLWDETQQRWKHQFSLPTARDATTAVVHENKWLIVIGGRNDAKQILPTVEMLDLHNNQWYSGAPLPKPAYKMTAAVIGNILVLLGGVVDELSVSRYTYQAFYVQLDDLISHATSKIELASPWQHLPDTPVASCTALAFHGALLAVGGNKPEDANATSIHLYKPSTKTWVEAGQLLTDRWRCACAVLSSSELFIAGGSTTALGSALQREVHIAALQ